MGFRYSPEIARKTLDFIDDKDLQVVIEKRLDELEKVFSVNANLSTIILSISCIEGIFKHIASIFKSAILASPDYPKKKDGNKKDFHKLTIEEIYKQGTFTFSICLILKSLMKQDLGEARSSLTKKGYGISLNKRFYLRLSASDRLLCCSISR